MQTYVELSISKGTIDAPAAWGNKLIENGPSWMVYKMRNTLRKYMYTKKIIFRRGINSKTKNGTVYWMPLGNWRI